MSRVPARRPRRAAICSAASPDGLICRDKVPREQAMLHVREPVLEPVSIDGLRPTQLAVGMREVEEKRKRLRERKGKKLGKHMIPVVLGPKDDITLSTTTIWRWRCSRRAGATCSSPSCPTSARS